jgi:hypothetical protein
VPNVRDFLNGFGIKGTGQKVDGLVIESVRCVHVLKVQYREYEYPLTIRFKSSKEITLSKIDIKKIIEKFNNDLNSGSRVIYSGYGNPYKCNIGKIDVEELSDEKFELTTLGICVRSFEIPKKKKV